MLTPADVTAAYQLILGRPPESKEIIQRQIDDARTFERLRDILLTSGEFVERVKTDNAVRTALYPATAAMVTLQPSGTHWNAVARESARRA